MIRLAFLINELSITNELTLFCHDVFLANEIDYEIIIFSSPANAIKYSGEKIDLLLCQNVYNDICLANIYNGLNSNSNINSVIFMSCKCGSTNEDVSNNSKSPTCFPLKSVKMIIENMAFDYNKIDVINLTVGKSEFHLLPSKICFVKGDGNYSTIHYVNDKLVLTCNLKKLANSFKDSSIIRIHKSYYANLLHVAKMNTDSLILNTGIMLPIGRTISKTCNELFKRFSSEVNLLGGS